MAKHLVMFKFKAFESEVAKQTQLEEIKQALEALKDKIECLREITVHFNTNPAETWDLLLDCTLDKMSDIEVYAKHPEHVAVAKNKIVPIMEQRACVDYE